MRLLKAALLPLLAVCLALFPAVQSSAISASDFFDVQFAAQFSKTVLSVGEVGSLTVTGSAVCTKNLDFPYNLAQAVKISGRVVGVSTSGAKVVLNSGYTMTLSPIPTKAGQTITSSQALALQFPSDAAPGRYRVSGETIDGQLQALNTWWPVTEFLPPSTTFGSLDYVTNVPTLPSLVLIAVMPSSGSVGVGLTRQFTAAGTYSDASQVDITGSVVWTSSDASKATIGASGGLATGIAAGSVTITASLGAIISNTVTLTVTAPPPPTTSLTPVPTPTPTTKPAAPVQLSGLGSDSLLIDVRGVVTRESRLATPDAVVTLIIARGTTVLGAQGNSLLEISASPSAVPPVPPPQEVLIVAYSFGPDGARFNPAITLTISYPEGGLPPGIAETGLYIAYWDGTQWQKLLSQVDVQKNTVSVNIEHFSTYALLAAVVASSPTATAAPSPAFTPAPTLSSSPPPSTLPGTPASPVGVIWWLMGGIFAVSLLGVVVVGANVRRRKRAHGAAKRP